MLSIRAGILPALLFLSGIVTLAANANVRGLRENIEYGRAGEASLRMDAHLPNGEGPFPAVILVHGGGWVSGDRRTNLGPLFRPLEEAGYAWFSISYRLVRNITDFGAGILDVQQAVRHVREHAAEYRIDPNRIALIGESAGAQLASMAALTPGANVKAVVAFYSPSDLVALARSSHYVPERIRRQIQGTPWEAFVIEGLRQLSPVNHVSRNMPPFLLIHGTSDTLVPFEQSEKMCAAIRTAGGQCELVPVRNGGHGVRWWETSRLTGYKSEMVRWLEQQMVRPAAAA